METSVGTPALRLAACDVDGDFYRTALPSLVFRAQTVHRRFHPEAGCRPANCFRSRPAGARRIARTVHRARTTMRALARQGLLDPEHVVSVAREAAGRV
jgi:hypothetical protein